MQCPSAEHVNAAVIVHWPIPSSLPNHEKRIFEAILDHFTARLASVAVSGKPTGYGRARRRIQKERSPTIVLQDSLIRCQIGEAVKTFDVCRQDARVNSATISAYAWEHSRGDQSSCEDLDRHRRADILWSDHEIRLLTLNYLSRALINRLAI